MMMEGGDGDDDDVANNNDDDDHVRVGRLVIPCQTCRLSLNGKIAPDEQGGGIGPD